MRVAQALGGCGLEAREARLLLAAAAGFSEAGAVAFPEKVLPIEIEAQFASFAERRRQGEPIAYILGEKEFYGLALEVNSSVLIPRPETELLVELALQREPASVLDLGTGCGAVALAVKKHRPQATLTAVEASAAALALARRNAATLGLDVEFLLGEWLAPVAGRRFDCIVANPPYVAEGDPHLCAGDLRFEPRRALVSGADGLDDLRKIACAVPANLNPGGWVLVEHGMGQEAAVQTLFRKNHLECVTTWPDLAGIARVTGARVKS